MVAVIDELEARAWPSAARTPTTAARAAIFLTARGQQTLERVRALAGELQREFFAALTAEERETLHRRCCASSPARRSERDGMRGTG